MKSILLNCAKSLTVLVFLFSVITFSAIAQDFSPEVAFNIDNSVMGQSTSFSFEISQSEGETDIANSTITTNGGSFDFSVLSVGDVVGNGSGFIGGGSSSGEFTLVISSISESSADLDVMSDDELLGAMQIANSSENNGVLIYSTSPGDENLTTAGNNQQVEISGIFINPMNTELTFNSSIVSESNPDASTSESSSSFDLLANFSVDISITLSNTNANELTDITFSVSQDSGEEDIDNILYTFDGGSFALSSLTVGDVVGNGSGSFGGGFDSGDYTIVVAQLSETTALFNAEDELGNILASFSVENNFGGASISSVSPGDDNTTTAGNSNVFTLEGIFTNPNADFLNMTADLVSELQSTQTETFQEELDGATDFTPELSVEFSNADCNEEADMTFTISQEAGEVDMTSAIITMTGGSFDFTNSSVGDLVGTSTGFYAGDVDFSLSLFINEITVDGAIITAVDDADETQTSTFTITNLIGGGVQITVTAPDEPGEQNNVTAGNSTTVTISSGFVNADEGSYEYYGSFTSELNELFEFEGQYDVVCPCEDVEVSEDFILCPGETLTIGENTYTEEGEYVNTYPLASGCDSIVTTTLAFFAEVVVPSIGGETDVTENESYGYSVLFQNQYLYQWGVVNGTINSGQGTSDVNITWGDGPSTGTVWLLLSGVDSGCKSDTAFLEVTISEAVGVTENELLSVSVYPNPFKEYTTVEFNNSDNDIYRLSLMDASGRIVMNTTTHSNKFIIKKENLNEGIYFLEIDGKYKSRQIVVIQ